MINITLEAKSITELYEKLVALLSEIPSLKSDPVLPELTEVAGSVTRPTTAQTTPTAPAQAAPVPTAPVPTALTTATAAPTAVPNTVTTPAVPIAPAAPPAPAAAAPVPVTTAPVYTLDQIARAGTSLIDAGKMDALLELLARFGVSAVTQLGTEMYGAVATELRSLGAQI